MQYIFNIYSSSAGSGFIVSGRVWTLTFGMLLTVQREARLLTASPSDTPLSILTVLLLSKKEALAGTCHRLTVPVAGRKLFATLSAYNLASNACPCITVNNRNNNNNNNFTCRAHQEMTWNSLLLLAMLSAYSLASNACPCITLA